MLNRTQRFVVLAVLLTAACAPAAPTSQALTAADETALRGEFDAVAKDLQAGNFQHWSDGFTAGGTVSPANASDVSGAAARLAWAKTLPPIESLTFQNVKVVGEGSTAWGTSDYVTKFKGVPADSGRQLVAFKKQADGKWLVESVMFSSRLPLPGAPAPAKPAKPAAKK